jgi:8-hydroxy-5-deazaflavin:NADPH oxidoreductase
MKIAVIGAGKIGGTIGGRWEGAGHEVVYGLRDPAKKEGARSVPEALKGSEAVLLAIPGDVVVDFLRENAKSLDGKVVIDATNNLRGASMSSLSVAMPLVPSAKWFRAFNTYGWDVFANPVLGGKKPDLFYAGPGGADQDVVEGLISDAGCRPIRVGGPDQADVVDGVLRLWFTLAQSRGRRIAFQLIAD